MYPAKLKINTKAGQTGTAPSSSKSPHREFLPLPTTTTTWNGAGRRLRSSSNASSSSSLSIISPTSSSTNASSSSLHLPTQSCTTRVLRSPSPLDDTVRLGAEYVLAMHDYAPQHNNATCLSFRAGQVIHVLNRDTSGWWDGELEGRRGWFPSNYVNTDSQLLTEENLVNEQPRKRGHIQSNSTASTTSWDTISSKNHDHQSSTSESVGQDIDLYCPPLMIPLLHGLSLLQSAVRANRISHFQPSTACIVSSVRTVLSATETLSRDAPILQRFPVLAHERRGIFSALDSLVSQAKKTSNGLVQGSEQDHEVENMLRMGGQVFAHLRRFLAIAIQCGVELPERPSGSRSNSSSTKAEGKAWSDGDSSFDTPPVTYGTDSPNGRTPRQNRAHNREIIATPGATLRAKSLGELRISNNSTSDPDSDSALPLLPNRGPATQSKQNQYLAQCMANRHRPNVTSISSTSSSSSFSSEDSSSPPAPPPFPQGPSTTMQVMAALRHTHDQYLSTIAAFIGHAHSHSRTSHASSTGHLYELVREIVEMVCKLLTIVEAVMRHPDVPGNRLRNLQSAKEGLYNVTSSLAESVRLLTISLPPMMTDEEEKQSLLRSATSALKAGADCVAAVKICLNRSVGEKPFIIYLPELGDGGSLPYTPSKFSKPRFGTSHIGLLNGYVAGDEDLTIQAQSPSPARKPQESSSGSENGSLSTSSARSNESNATSPDEHKHPPPLNFSHSPVEPDLPSPTSFVRTDDGTTWEGSARNHAPTHTLEEKIFHGELPTVPSEPIPDLGPMGWLLSHDYSLDDVAYNSEGHLVGATMDVLVEKMTPHDSIVDPAFSAVFFLTFRLFSSPIELVDAVIARYNLLPPRGLSNEDLQLWQQRKGIPVRLRVSNFIKIWAELYWRPGVDDPALPGLMDFTCEGLAALFPGPAQRIIDLLEMRRRSTDLGISPNRSRDPGMSINPPTMILTSEVPRPTMTKTLLVALRSKNFTTISVTDFDALELARQLTIMECTLYCAIQPEEVLETGQEGSKPPINVRAVSSLSTVITGWVAESILNEPDIKKRTLLIKFFIKVADRCTALHNYSTPRSMLAALDSSTISRLHQTWLGLHQKYKLQLDSLRRLADHSRNYHEYRSKLRNTAPPAVPFLGLYLTDVTFCREGNPSHRASPLNASKKLLNFNKYHKLARIVQDMQRFQVPYNLKAIPEVQEYLNDAFEKSRHHGDLQDLYRRSLLVEPKQPADTAPVGDMRQLFNWATRSQS